MRARLLVLTFVCGFGLASCVGTRELADPVVVVQSERGSELGVSTDYGVVFLGRTAQAGEVEVVVWYGDGPSYELAVIEPVGSGLFTAEPEIKLPAVPISFRVPRPGEKLILVGRRDGKLWESTVSVSADPHVQGLIVAAGSRLADDASQVGTGAYVETAGTKERLLVGLVSGVLELRTNDGGLQRYLTLVGPDDLWRLVTFKRELPQKPRWVYRDDIM